MSTKINHKAFLDLENGLAQKASKLWRLEWVNLSSKIEKAIQHQDWLEANRLVDLLDFQVIVRKSLQYALTIGLSALLLGASRLSTVGSSVIAKKPPIRQLKNAAIQWGFQVGRNAPALLKQRMHSHLADLEHQAKEKTQVIKLDPYHEPAGSPQGGEFAPAPGDAPDHLRADWQKLPMGEQKKELKEFFNAVTPWATLPKPEKDAMEAYTGNMYPFVNRFLRGQSKSDAWETRRNFIIQGLDKTISASTLPQALNVYRGITNAKAVLGGAVNENLVGKTFTDKGFVSTSLDYNKGLIFSDNDTIMILRLPKGFHAAAVSNKSNYEAEFILPRGTTFKITQVETIDVKDSDGVEYKKLHKIVAQPVLEKNDTLDLILTGADDNRFVWSPGDLDVAIQKDDTDFDQAELQDFLTNVRVDGEDFMSLAASLMVSRLSSFGFLAQAQYQGITQYRISAVLDEHTCPVCEELDGQVFDVSAGVALASSLMDAEDADSLKSIAPWPSQSKSSVATLQDSDSADLVDAGLALPPYHPNCRCITVAVDDARDTSDTAGEAESEESEIASEDAADVIGELLEGQETDPDFGSILVALGLLAIPLGDNDQDKTDEELYEDEDDDTDEDVGYLDPGEDVAAGEAGDEYDEVANPEEDARLERARRKALGLPPLDDFSKAEIVKYNHNHDEHGLFSSENEAAHIKMRRMLGGKETGTVEGIQNVPFYHGTSAELWEAIQKEGITPSKAGTGGDTWLKLHGEDHMAQVSLDSRPASVYITLNEKFAKQFAGYATEVHPGSKGMLLEAHIPATEWAKFHNDELMDDPNNAIRFEGTIKPEWITKHTILKGGDQVLYLVILYKEPD